MRNKRVAVGSRPGLTERNEVDRQRSPSADGADRVDRNDVNDCTEDDDGSSVKRWRTDAKCDGENEPENHSTDSSKRLEQDARAVTTDSASGPLLTSTLTFLQAILKPSKHDVGTQTSVALVGRKIKTIEKRLNEQEIAELQVALEMHRNINGKLTC